jgi:hypothetical protein
MNLRKPRREPTFCLGLRITQAQRQKLKEEAVQYGYSLSSLVRLRIFGKTKGLHLTRRPHPDMQRLGDVLGKLAALIDEVNRLRLPLEQIAARLDRASRDLFGLDGALRRLEEFSERTMRLLVQIEAAINGRLTGGKTSGE